MRLIDADALEEGKFHSIENWTPIESASWQQGWNDAIDAIINNAPIVDAVKHGHWEGEQRGRWIYAKCGLCGTVHDVRTNYCPHCGAKMDEMSDEVGR